MEKLNSVHEFEFADGEKTELTLTFYKLYQLKSKRKDLYEKYGRIMGKKNSDELEMISALYIAYVCAHLDEDDLMTEEEFMIKCGSDRDSVAEAVQALLRPKKHRASANHSQKKR